MLFKTTYFITNDTIENLKKEEIPDDILQQLDRLKYYQIEGINRFLDYLRTNIGYSNTELYKSKILRHASQKGFFNSYGGTFRINKKTLRLIDDDFKKTLPEEDVADILLKLQDLKYLTFKGKKIFLKILNDVLENEISKKYKKLILFYATVKEPDKVDDNIIYRITNETIKNYEKEGISDVLLERLVGLKYQSIKGTTRFINYVKSAIGEEETEDYISIILKYASMSHVNYLITNNTIENLRSENVPYHVLKELEGIKNERISDKKRFWFFLQEKIGYENTERYGSKILENTLQKKELVSNKKRFTALLLCGFFGWLGTHRFYVKRYFSAFLLMFSFGGFGIFWIIDFILILGGRFKDNQKNMLIDWV